MKIARKVILIAAALIVAGLIAWAYRPEAVLVSVARVGQGPLQVLVEEDGQTRIHERYVVTPPVAGYMRRVIVHVGDRVNAGDPLVTLEPLPPVSLDARSRAEARAGVARAAAAVRAAEVDAQAAAASATFAIGEQARLRPLFDTGAVSKTQYERAASEADRAHSALVAARAAIDIARYEKQAAETALRYAAGERNQTEKIVVTSPVTGAVLDVLRESEGVVTAGQPLLTVGDPRSLELVTDVLSSDAVRIKPGMKVLVERWGGDEPLEARVRTVDPTAFTKVSALGVEEQRVKVVSDLVTPPDRWTSLGDAYRVETRFVIWEASDVLRIPHSALFHVGDKWALFVARNGRVQRRFVSLGQRGVYFAEVTQGLQEGDFIVTYPDDRLADGTRIGIREVE